MALKVIGITLIVLGGLLVAFEIAIVMGERHSLKSNWPWFAGVTSFGVALIFGGIFMVRK